MSTFQRGAGMFEEARQRAEKYVIDESNRRQDARRPISPTLQKLLSEVNEPQESKAVFKRVDSGHGLEWGRSVFQMLE